MEPGSRVRKGERDKQSGGENGRASSTAHRGVIYPLSLLTAVFFFLSFAFSFVFAAQKLLPFLPIHLFLSSHPIPLPSSHPCLVALGQQHAIISGHHHHRYGFMAARTSRILGGNLWDEALIRARPRQPARNVCKWYAHSKRTLGRRGERRPSSCWALRKMSDSGQKNDNKTPPPPFLLLSFSSSCI